MLIKKILKQSLLLLSIITLTVSAQKDIAGSKDHPLITRYPNSAIEWYDVKEYERYKIATGPVTGYRHIDKWLTVEGKVTRIYYALGGQRSVSEVYLNYVKALKKSGFKILGEGLNNSRNVGKKIGGRGWLGVYFAENVIPPKVQLLKGTSSSGGSAFVSGKLTKNNKTVYVAVSLTQFSSNRVSYMIDIIEEEAVEDDFVFVNAAAMENEIETNGKIALYGIYFDTDKATIKSESEPTFKEVVTLLKKNPQLNIYVVGHTDMKGTLSHNLKLSKDRATAVVKELTQKYKVSKNRLTPDGVGPLAPASTNTNNAGRKLNRRVELVGK